MTEEKNSDDPGMGRAWWASAVVVVIVVVGLVAVLVTRGSRQGGDDAAGARSSSSTPTRSASSSPTSSSASSSSTPARPTADAWPDAGCNGSPGSAAPAQAGLLAVSWEPVGSMSLPTSKELGPTKTTDSLRRCFQHSPAGAVMAAANIFGSLAPANYRQVLQQQMTPGAGRDQTMVDLVPSDLTGPRGQFAGYKLNGCTPAACNLSLAIQGQGVWGQEDFTLVWSDGDWKLDGTYAIPPLGQLPSGLPQGWVAWAP